MLNKQIKFLTSLLNFGILWFLVFSIPVWKGDSLHSWLSQRTWGVLEASNWVPNFKDWLERPSEEESEELNPLIVTPTPKETPEIDRRRVLDELSKPFQTK